MSRHDDQFYELLALIRDVGGVRNRVINGEFDIWQRGAGPFTGNGATTADLWRLLVVGSTHSVTRQAFALGNTIPGYEPEFYLRSTVTSVAGAGNRADLVQRCEDVRTFAGQQVTLSFWAKADAAKNIAVELTQVFGTGGSPSTFTSTPGGLVALSTSWQRHSIAVALPSIAGKTIGTGADDYIGIGFWFDAGSTYTTRTSSLGQQSGTFDLWGVQLEPGPVASEFVPRPIGDSLAKCQRYFVRWAGATPTNLLGGGLEGTNAAMMTGQLPVTMRAAPTFASSNVQHYSATGGAAAITLSQNRSTPNTIALAISATGTAGQASTLFVNTGNGYIEFSAEL